MKKIITAMGNNKLAEKLKEVELFEVVTRDIPYNEGIIEVLNENKDIDVIILSEILDGEMTFKDTIKAILKKNKEIEIIVFVEEKNVEIQNFLFSNGIYKIYQNNEIDIETLINSLIDIPVENLDFINNELSKIRKKINENPDNYIDLTARGKVISITGSYNAGKSLITCMLGEEFSRKNLKTLIIDFDIYQESIKYLLNVSTYNVKEVANIDKQVIKISKYLDVVCVMNLLFNNENQIEYINLEDMIYNFKKQYDVILIDTTSDYKYKYLPRILKSSDEIIFTIVPTQVELKKAFNFFQLIVTDFMISQNKIKVILNKTNEFVVDVANIKEELNNANIVGKIEYDSKIEKNILERKYKTELKINEMLGGKNE